MATQNKKDVIDTHIQRRTITKINHDRRTALERSVKSISLGVGLNRFYVATILALTSAAVYTHNLFSPHEGILTHQCYISENTKINKLQRWNNDEDSTARNNWNARQKKTNSKTRAGPTKDRASSTNQHYPKLNSSKPLRWNHHRIWGLTRRRAIKEGSKVINRDWVNNYACSLSYNIYVVPNLFISKNDFTKLGSEVIASIYFSKFIY